MKILALTSSYPGPSESVASPFLHDWAAALVRRGHDVEVVAPSCRNAAAVRTSHEGVAVRYFNYCLPVSRQTLAYGAGMFENVAANPLRLLQLPPYLAAQYALARTSCVNVDVVHAHWLMPGGLVGAWLKATTGLPLVISVHSTDFHLLRRMPGGRLFLRLLVQRCDRLHFVAHYLQRAVAEWLAPAVDVDAKSYVAPMGVSDMVASWARSPMASRPTIGFIGRLVPMKGLEELLQACARVGPGRLLIAGAGPERGRLIRLATHAAYPCHFLGPVSGPTKSWFFDQSDIVVFPSRQYRWGRTEGVPVALLEALAAGRVVVAAAVGGIPEIVRHGENGYLFPAGDVRALVALLREILDQWPAARRVASTARDTGMRLRATTLSGVHEAVYTELLQSHALRLHGVNSDLHYTDSLG